MSDVVTSPAEKRWRPRDRRGPVCRYTFDDVQCDRRGAHYCRPRAERPVAFFAELLVHTKGRWARHPFELDEWQEHDVIRPLFGEVIWSDEWESYVRRYRIAVVCLGKKNGKSELAAGVVLYLLVGDDEEGAEVYGAARDTKQAGKVADVVERMRQLSPELSARLTYNRNSRRIYDQRTGSFFEVITADALGEQGHNPHGAYIDEVLSQRDDSLYNALRTAMGTRTEPLLLLVTTETNDPHGFGASQIDEAERIQAEPQRAPHVFAYVRKVPRDADPWDESLWHLANPALGSFKSLQSMREEALEARNDPARENAFRQFHLNQRVQATTRYLPAGLWASNVGEVAPTPEWIIPKIEGQRAWAGLDLSAKLDLTAWTVLTDELWCWWRLWVPDAIVPQLDEATAGKFSTWVRDGWVTATDGDVIDYDRVYADIEQDAQRFNIAAVYYDRWSGEPVRQEIERRTRLRLIERATTYEHMTEPMSELMRMLKNQELQHGGHPTLQWMADSFDAKYPRDDADRVRPVKPPRGKPGVRIDGIVSLLFAIDARLHRPKARRHGAMGF